MLDRFLSAERTALIMPRQEVTGRRQWHETKGEGCASAGCHI